MVVVLWVYTVFVWMTILAVGLVVMMWGCLTCLGVWFTCWITTITGLTVFVVCWFALFKLILLC